MASITGRSSGPWPLLLDRGSMPYGSSRFAQTMFHLAAARPGPSETMRPIRLHAARLRCRFDLSDHLLQSAALLWACRYGCRAMVDQFYRCRAGP